MSMISRNRRFERVPCRATVTLWCGREPYLLPASDLSAGGLFLSTETPLGEGALYTLRISLPGERGFTVLSRVARNQAGRSPLRSGGVALEFLDIAPRDREMLQRYVDRVQGQRAAAG